MYFPYFDNISLGKRHDSHLNELESLYPTEGCFVAIGQWFWRSGVLNFFNVFSQIRNYLYLPLKKRVIHHLNKGKFPLPKDALCQDWLQLAQRFWRKRFKFRCCICAILLLSPLGKVHDRLFEQTWMPYTQRCSVRSLVEIGNLVPEKKMKMWKRLQTDGWTDDDTRSEKLTQDFSSGELKMNSW